MTAASVASRLHFRYIHQARVARLSRAFARSIPTTARTVLDVGTGDGLLAWEIRQLRPELRFTGVDVHPRPENFIPVELFDGRRLPADDKSVDVVIFSDVLHHADNQEELLAEAARVARQAVVIKDHVADSVAGSMVLRAMDFAGNRHAGVSLPYNYLSTSEWRRAFEQTGLWVRRWDDQPDVYPAPLRWVIGRRLHVLTVVVPTAAAV
jgi:ubiquinone/menaquinone biosynthesis C-methylase UbiE